MSKFQEIYEESMITKPFYPNPGDHPDACTAIWENLPPEYFDDWNEVLDKILEFEQKIGAWGR
jgi:hypothetical protein